MATAAGFDQVMEALECYRILLATDPKLPGVAALVAGSPISMSWWGQPMHLV